MSIGRMTTDPDLGPVKWADSLMVNWPPALRLWAPTLACLAVLFFWTVLLYWPAVANAVYLWAHRSSYNHGFLIIPIAAYLIWDRRAVLAPLVPRPWLPGLPGLLAASALWFVVHAMGIMEGEHFLIVGLFQAIVVTLLGWRLYWALLLPMNYLWLMVPTGTLFFPVLQKLATDISAWLLWVSGIPVFAEGTLISVTTGDYLVAEGCSGLNFILSTLALAPLYATFVYASMRKRLIAVAIALVASVFANAFRIFAIIALAEFTDRQIDIVDDHLLYGWGFFLVVLGLMGWVGLRFADPDTPRDDLSEEGPPSADLTPHPLRRILGVTVLAAIALALLPLYDVVLGTPDLGIKARSPAVLQGH